MAVMLDLRTFPATTASAAANANAADATVAAILQLDRCKTSASNLLPMTNVPLSAITSLPLEK